MIIEVKKCIAAREYKGSLSFEVTPQKDQLLVPLTEFASNIKVTATFEIFEDDSVQVGLNLSYLLKGQCSYCLADAEKQVDFSEEVYFVTEDNDDDYRYDGVKIDLHTAVNDAILFSQPNLILCKDCCESVDNH